MNMTRRAVDAFNASVTSVEYPWPAGLTGLERIMLSACGDLQRLLSAFFTKPITIKRVYADTSPRTQDASPCFPITQKRQVHLICASRITCVATSTVVITSPECARLFLDEQYAIGQLFRRMGAVPQFNLLDVGTSEACEPDEDIRMRGGAAGRRVVRKLYRRYTLHVPGFDCEILEEFPDRDMFVLGDSWLTGCTSGKESDDSASAPSRRLKDILVDITQGRAGIMISLVVLALFYFLKFSAQVKEMKPLACPEDVDI